MGFSVSTHKWFLVKRALKRVSRKTPKWVSRQVLACGHSASFPDSSASSDTFYLGKILRLERKLLCSSVFSIQQFPKLPSLLVDLAATGFYTGWYPASLQRPRPHRGWD